jgi:hypothetical protein
MAAKMKTRGFSPAISYASMHNFVSNSHNKSKEKYKEGFRKVI